jgi:hypothetical protein
VPVDRDTCVVRGYRLEAVPKGAIDSRTVGEFPPGRKGFDSGRACLFDLMSDEEWAKTHDFVLWQVFESPVASTFDLRKQGEIA